MNDNQLTSVFMRLRERLRNSAMSILHSDTDTEDALQDAFCRLWTRRADISGEEHAAGLSYMAVRSASIDRLRSRKVYFPEELSDEPIEETDDSEAAYDEIDVMLKETLSSRDYGIVRKREMYDYSYDELAEEYGITEEAVRAVVSRGRRAIRAQFVKRKQ